MLYHITHNILLVNLINTTINYLYVLHTWRKSTVTLTIANLKIKSHANVDIYARIDNKKLITIFKVTAKYKIA